MDPLGFMIFVVHFLSEPPRRALRPAWFLLPLCAAFALAGEAPLSLKVRARAIAPGEPLRVDVRALQPMADLRGEFLGRPVHLVRIAAGDDDRAQTWSGWTMVALDANPGAASIEVTGTTSGGRRVEATHAVTVADREFPEERLTVKESFVSPPREVEERLARERAKLASIYASRRDVIPHARPFVRPVDGANTSVFGMRRFFNDKPRSPHPGQDLRAAEGTPVRASGPGMVVLAQDLYYSGNTVILDHGGGLFTLYAHLSEIQVTEGQESEAGDVLGKSGSTGRVTGPHLHWGAKIGDAPFDPSALLDAALFD